MKYIHVINCRTKISRVNAPKVLSEDIAQKKVLTLVGYYRPLVNQSPKIDFSKRFRLIPTKSKNQFSKIVGFELVLTFSTFAASFLEKS